MNQPIFLLLGTNLGDKSKNLADAITAIRRSVGNVKNSSGIYKTAAWGKTDQQDFLNQAIEVESALSPKDLLWELQAIENQLGRSRQETWGPRSMDIDILLYGNSVVNESDLIIPHPRIQERRFALTPLSEIAPGMVHPILRLTIQTLLDRCPDPLRVERVLKY